MSLSCLITLLCDWYLNSNSDKNLAPLLFAAVQMVESKFLIIGLYFGQPYVTFEFWSVRPIEVN